MASQAIPCQLDLKHTTLSKPRNQTSKRRVFVIFLKVSPVAAAWNLMNEKVVMNPSSVAAVVSASSGRTTLLTT